MPLHYKFSTPVLFEHSKSDGNVDTREQQNIITELRELAPICQELGGDVSKKIRNEADALSDALQDYGLCSDEMGDAVHSVQQALGASRQR
jgi:hypothetical protein